MKGGCEAAPTNRSVAAKQASKMLYLFCSLGLVFTPNYHQKRYNLRTMEVTSLVVISDSLHIFCGKPLTASNHSCFYFRVGS